MRDSLVARHFNAGMLQLELECCSHVNTYGIFTTVEYNGPMSKDHGPRTEDGPRYIQDVEDVGPNLAFRGRFADAPHVRFADPASSSNFVFKRPNLVSGRQTDRRNKHILGLPS